MRLFVNKISYRCSNHVISEMSQPLLEYSQWRSKAGSREVGVSLGQHGSPFFYGGQQLTSETFIFRRLFNFNYYDFTTNN